MKKLSLLFFLPALAFGSYSKPELIARMNYTSAWNVPDNVWCFSGEPVSHQGRIHLNCMDHEGQIMAMWDQKEFSVVARAEDEQYFAGLTSSMGRVSWYESDALSVRRSYVHSSTLSSRPVKNIDTFADGHDSFLPLSEDAFFFKSKGATPELWIWKDDVVTAFFNPEASYIFSPQVGSNGEIAFKSRSIDLSERSPDKIWLYQNGSWKVVLEDKDSNPSSPWITFRNQLSVDGNKILVIASDGKGEALILVQDGKTEIIARAGKELSRFDFFTPKLRGGVIVSRGENFRGEKVTYVKDEGEFRPLISQGDIVHTDQGPGRVHYQNQDSIFYGSPGIDENGNIILQATLTDPDYPRTLLGVGLIRFNKE